MLNEPLKFKAPMGAKEYEANMHRVTFPCFVQPKVDGVRCISNGIQFWSKNGLQFSKQNMRHLVTTQLPYLVDGELSLGDDHDFEDIVSAVKRDGSEESAKLQFNVFDIMTDQGYRVRKAQLRGMFKGLQLRILSGSWQRLKTLEISNETSLHETHRHFLKCGYEGSIIRNAEGLYKSARSIDLLKWKPMLDEEFRIVEVLEAKGKDRGTPIFVCAVDRHGTTFRVRPAGTHEQRNRMWRDRRNLVGKLLTVEYQNYTKYGKPRFPRAKMLRDYE